MRQTKLYLPTLRDTPNSAEVKSHILLLKAGYIHQTATGIYTYLPMANKIIQNIEKIVRQELDNISANEVKLPFLEPSSLWKKSGRWQDYGKELFRLADRHEREFALAPTHEEVAADLIKNYLNSYKKLPINIYQIQTKMRDERRPRFGLIRSREFIMMDGYTFNENDESLKKSYQEYYDAYLKIFNRLDIDYKIVNADNGSMGGKYSHEFMALSEIGEDFIAYDEESNVAYNTEIAPVNNKYAYEKELDKNIEKFATPNIKKIDELSNKYNINIEKIVKAVAYNVDDNLVIGFVLGHREVEETKILNLCSGVNIEIANNDLLEKNGIVPGFIGLQDLPSNIKIFVDRELKYRCNLVTGANEINYHLKNFNIKNISDFFDIRKIEIGDFLEESGKPIKIKKGIEIGHVFALGDKYTRSLGVEYLTKEQKNKIPIMGSYGIGISRLLSTIIEQNSDDLGIILPKIISPYRIHILPLDYNRNEEQTEYTNKFLETLEKYNISYLIDDRQERPAIKFKDADLIGIPYQLIIGRKFTDDIVEFKERKSGDKKEMKLEQVIELLKGEIYE